jgi:ribosomal-protein-alanine N-acetyltransferase
LEGVVIRDMLAEDLPRVYEVESQFYGTPWSIRSFSHELGNRDAILKVAVCHEQVVGYICIRSLLDITHLLKITVLPKFRRRGIGRALFQNALQTLKNSRPDTHELTLEVRESNSAAINLYKQAGFKETGRRPGYYRRPDEDAIIMGLELLQ